MSHNGHAVGAAGFQVASIQVLFKGLLKYIYIIRIVYIYITYIYSHYIYIIHVSQRSRCRRCGHLGSQYLGLYAGLFEKALKAGLSLVRTNVRIQWNSVYKAFHRIRFCGNEPIVR